MYELKIYIYIWKIIIMILINKMKNNKEYEFQNSTTYDGNEIKIKRG